MKTRKTTKTTKKAMKKQGKKAPMFGKKKQGEVFVVKTHIRAGHQEHLSK